MSEVKVTQRNATRNQSTADYQSKRIFIFDNRFIEGTYKNNAETDDVLSVGKLCVRDTATANGFLPATNANLANVVGVVDLDGSVTLAENATTNINVCTKGTIDGNLLVLPSGVTLNTTVGSKSLRDVLEAIGLHVDTSTVENTKFDN